MMSFHSQAGGSGATLTLGRDSSSQDASRITSCRSGGCTEELVDEGSEGDSDGNGDEGADECDSEGSSEVSEGDSDDNGEGLATAVLRRLKEAGVT